MRKRVKAKTTFHASRGPAPRHSRGGGDVAKTRLMMLCVTIALIVAAAAGSIKPLMLLCGIHDGDY